LTAGEITGKPEEYYQIHKKMKSIFEELGQMWEENKAKYDDYISHTPCPFLVNNACSIYEIRPKGCRLFPRTAFGMQTQDCASLIRFKKQRSALLKGRAYKETYQFFGADKNNQSIKPSTFSEKQYKTCSVRLNKAGITEDELNLFYYFNLKNK